MKIKNLIKADFFIHPELYGYSVWDDIDAIWREIIKPNIKEYEQTKLIDNSSINTQIGRYRKALREFI